MSGTAPTDRSAQAFAFLQQLASDMSRGQVSFPTFVDAALRVRMALNDPNVDVEHLARIIAGEPLLSARLVRLANSAALNRGGAQIADLRTAVMRVGFSAVRTTAAALAMEQVRASKELQQFPEEAERTWRHSLQVAAIAHLLARVLTRVNADEALFAGLVHDIGRFYLLSRAAGYPGLGDRRDELEALVFEWHASIGQSILGSFQVPDSVLDAVGNHEAPVAAYPPRTLADVIALANRLAHRPTPLGPGDATPGAEALPGEDELQALLAEHAEELRSLVAALGH